MSATSVYIIIDTVSISFFNFFQKIKSRANLLLKIVFINKLVFSFYNYFFGNFVFTSCELLLSTLNPTRQAPLSSNLLLTFANAIISVVHTGVKSLNVGIVILIFQYLLSSQILQFYHYKSI